MHACAHTLLLACASARVCACVCVPFARHGLAPLGLPEHNVPHANPQWRPTTSVRLATAAITSLGPHVRRALYMAAFMNHLKDSLWRLLKVIPEASFARRFPCFTFANKHRSWSSHYARVLLFHYLRNTAAQTYLRIIKFVRLHIICVCLILVICVWGKHGPN
jgi:hypothetical protein